jgi:hypothetical protein
MTIVGCILIQFYECGFADRCYRTLVACVRCIHFAPRNLCSTIRPYTPQTRNHASSYDEFHYRTYLSIISQVYQTILAPLNVYSAGFLQYILFGLFYFICNVLYSQFGKYCSSAALLVHWFMLSSCISTDFLFSYCCCSCLHVRLVAVCRFGVLQT